MIERKIIKSNGARVELFKFEKGSYSEYHAMIHAENHKAGFEEQLKALIEATESLLANEIAGATPIFKRYFLSDARNQAEKLCSIESGSPCAISLIEQPPLDGSKVALLLHSRKGVKLHKGEDGVVEVECGKHREFWCCNQHGAGSDPEKQTDEIFENYISKLAKRGLTLRDNALRTWFFVHDIDNNYGGMVRSRNNTFAREGLTPSTHFIASTGIAGSSSDPNQFVTMDGVAISGIESKDIHYISAPTHLNPTYEYGVSFERGTRVEFEDHTLVLISGTASIDNKGEILHRGDISRQTERMCENVEVLLKSAGCSFEDVSHIIVYLRNATDYSVVNRIIEEKFPNLAKVILLAPICRPEWLIEMECMALK